MSALPITYTPRIYSVQAIPSLPEAGALAQYRELGFDHLCLLSAAGISPETLEPLLAEAQKLNMAVLIEVALDEFDCGDEFYQHNKQLFGQADPDRLPDPRVDVAQGRIRLIKPEFLKGNPMLEEMWERRLSGLLNAGAAGFVCHGLNRLPDNVWANLSAKLKHAFASSRLIAWEEEANEALPPQFDALVMPISAESIANGDLETIFSSMEAAQQENQQKTRAFILCPTVAAAIYRSKDAALIQRAAKLALHIATEAPAGLLVSPTPEHISSGHKKTLNPFSPELVQDWLKEEFLEIPSNSDALQGTFKRIGGDTHIALFLQEASEQLLAVNTDLHHARALPLAQVLAGAQKLGYTLPPDAIQTSGPSFDVSLQPGELHRLPLTISKPISVVPEPFNREQLANAPRIAIEKVGPAADDGRFAVKRRVGDIVTVEADVFMDTHDKIGVALLWREADSGEWQRCPMRLVVNDRWSGQFALQRIGRYVFAVEAWHDKFGTFVYGLDKKVRAGVDVKVEIEEGRILLEKAAFALKAGGSAKNSRADKVAYGKKLEALQTALKGSQPSTEFPVSAELNGVLQQYPEQQRQALGVLLSPHALDIMRQVDPHDFLTRSKEYPLKSDRTAAEFSSWYEMFPRSQSGDTNRHGTFDDVIRRLPAVSAMGFDTLYFTPIHPIGRKNRKGRNNTLEPGPDDPGSPYAIGSEEGGHDAIHPQLGTWDDFRRMRDEAAKYGLEIALDFAIQCAPDHPWLKQHPEWFDWRPDGTIKYAENPPKKYQDIVNVDFYTEGAIPDLWVALRDIVLLWVKEGVRTFRVDNPHTKPLPFWEWLIRQVQDEYPDVIFLAEAFTAPKMMNRLAKLGFTQSYTYFTWRNTKWDLTEYLTQLSTGEEKEFFRPQFFANTPDIHPYYLQTSGRPGYLVRAALATTLSGLWGISSGYELCEADALPGREEFNHSEKYEIRAWDWDRPGNIVAEIGLLNRLRKQYPQLQTHLGLTFHPAGNDQVIFYSKIGKENRWPVPEVIVVAINLDPHHAQQANIELPLYQVGLPDHAPVQVQDLVRGNQFTLSGKWQSITLDPNELPFAIWRLSAGE